jgi:hypothetical protein
MTKEITVAEYQRRQQRVEQLRRQDARLAGAMAQTAKDLHREFAVGTLDKARKLLDRLEREAEQAEQAAAAAEKAFTEQWGQQLEGG